MLLKTSFQLRFPWLMGNIIKILLSRDEESLACYLVAFYQTYIDVIMIEKAIERDHYDWLNFLWIFQKNKVIDPPDQIREPIKETVLKFDDLFKMVEEITKKNR